MEIYFGEIEQAHGSLAREQAVQDLKTLIAHTDALVKATAQDVHGEVKEIRARVAVALEQARVTCAELQRQSAMIGRNAARRADVVIRKHPYESIGVALGAGLLLGLLATCWLPCAKETCASCD